jgi:hypothetical protein
MAENFVSEIGIFPMIMASSALGASSGIMALSVAPTALLISLASWASLVATALLVKSK